MQRARPWIYKDVLENKKSRRNLKTLQYIPGILKGCLHYATLCAYPGKAVVTPWLVLRSCQSRKWELKLSCKLLEIWRFAFSQGTPSEMLGETQARHLRKSANHWLIQDIWTQRWPLGSQEWKKKSTENACYMLYCKEYRIHRISLGKSIKKWAATIKLRTTKSQQQKQTLGRRRGGFTDTRVVATSYLKCPGFNKKLRGMHRTLELKTTISELIH